ncbi:hypothetical protein BVC80_897g27 [Macleaya cordata]|uniref:LOB domain-containing protein n=1 Tax=Macleaya cordata TaxID=56857 RepID=A0A200QFP9_MACCD|nr:hypothetical protein BVC80_897g27 [Macleaya cordata]
MSCNGCRVLRKGCSESCILRPCLQWIESPEAQGHATVFVAKFFGRAGLMSFISAVPENQRPALFQSLLFEACGRTVNPVNGAVGLLWTGNWQLCQTAVETVLRGGTLRPISDFTNGILMTDQSDGASESQPICTDMKKMKDPYSRSKASKRKGGFNEVARFPPTDLDLSLTTSGGGVITNRPEKRRPGTPSMNSEESVTTSFDSGDQMRRGEPKVLDLFV